MPVDKLASYLMSAYRYQVSSRGCEFVDDGETLSVIKEVAACLTEDSSKFGIMFSGFVGNGKTTMMFSLRQCLTWLRNANLIPDYMGYTIFPAKEISRDMKDFLTFDEICRTDCLGIDDLGGEAAEQMVYGNVHTPITDLLEKRYDKQLFTVLTTNLTRKQRLEQYGGRLFDRFNEMFHNIVFKGGSYR